jgi:acyl-CoA thioester hydrolase
VTGSLYQCRRDYSRWSVEHQILINNETIAAVVRVDGAFIDTYARKLVVPKELLQSMMDKLPKSEQFIWQNV